MTPNAPATRAEQFAFLRAAHDGPLKWKALCLSLARQAPGLPGVYPSALAAAEATPQNRRVYEVADLRRGMVAYFDDPHDSNPYAHIVTVAGWATTARNLSSLITVTNDAERSGGVDWVRGSFYPDKWGDNFLFGATWLNGYDLPRYDHDRATPDPKVPTLGTNLHETYAYAIREVKAAIARRRRRKSEAAAEGDRAAVTRHNAVIRALVADLAELRETVKTFPR